MIDIVQHRSVIGLFNRCQLLPSRIRKLFRRAAYKRARPARSFLFIALTALVLSAQVFDPAIEKNPGPSPTSSAVAGNSSQKECFYKVWKIIDDVTEISSHRFFLNSCLELQATPRGLTSHVSLSSRKASKELLNLFAALQKSFSEDLVRLIINHYNDLLNSLGNEYRLAVGSLKDMCTGDEFQGYLFQLDSRRDKKAKTLQERKLRKIDSLLLNHEKWLPALNLSYVELNFITQNEEICDAIVNAFMLLLNKQFPFTVFQSSSFHYTMLEYSIYESIHVHHNGQGHFVTSSSIGGQVKVYDSLNTLPSADLMKQLTALYSPPDAGPNVVPSVFCVPMQSTQQGAVDCGIFALAYATELAYQRDPSLFRFDQSLFRPHLLKCLESHTIEPFPKLHNHVQPSQPFEFTENVAEEMKWSTPKVVVKQPKVVVEGLKLENRFQLLSDDVDLRVEQGNPIHSTLTTPTPTPTARKAVGNVTNLSDKNLPKSAFSLLELGLSYCPSVLNFNKEEVCEDFLLFFRRLKLREYFKDSPGKDNAPEELDRENMKWIKQNPDWYPAAVQENRSPALLDFISNCVRDSREAFITRENKVWNNLSGEQRKSLKDISQDKSIVVKPSDKSGGVVVMNTCDYERSCLDQLENPVFYEEVTSDPNPDYRDMLDGMINELHSANLISDLEKENMLKGSRTPNFYGLPKLHNPFEVFPDLRPICSGSSGVTVRSSEFVDSFLKAAAQKVPSFIQDTTDFVKKLASCQLPVNSKCFLVTLDVKSLYTNISHEEGISACRYFLNQRNNQRFPTEKLLSLISFILKSNTMKFANRLFHQIKGTAMGTPMAVNYANLFMAGFEKNMLADFEKEYGFKPACWYRFIDDIFFVWTGSEESLNQFLDFVNSYAERRNMSSNIKFKNVYSDTSVSFLDTVVKIQNGALSTDLYNKPTSAHDYLHRSSYHPQHLIRAIPKSQFIRIRRICSLKSDYKRHAESYIKHFKARGYKEPYLRKISEEVENADRASFLNYQPKKTSARIPLVLTYHHKLQDLPFTLKRNYQKMIRDHPDMKAVFPEPPIVSFRRPRSIRDKIVRADHCTKQSRQTLHNHPPTKAHLAKFMNNSGHISNAHSKTKYPIEGGSITTKGTVYAVRCIKCDKLYVGQTTTPLNERLNRHIYDTANRPDACELTQHFANCGCDIRTDIEISILSQVNGSETRMLLEEDKWITRLMTVPPYGLNEKLSTFGKMYFELFKPVDQQ